MIFLVGKQLNAQDLFTVRSSCRPQYIGEQVEDPKTQYLGLMGEETDLNGWLAIGP